MKKLTITRLALVALLGLLLLPAAAPAKKLRHKGQIVGDAEASVTLRVTKNGGRVTKVSSFKAIGVITSCDSGLFRFQFFALNPTKVNKKGHFRERLDNPDGSVLRISGKVKAGGKKTVGNIKTNDFEADTGEGEETCRVKKQRFSTEKT